MVLTKVSRSLCAPEFSCLRTELSLLCNIRVFTPGPSLLLWNQVLFWLHRAPRCSHSHSLSLYVSDSISVSPRLSLNTRPPSVLGTTSCWPGHSSDLLKCYHCAPQKLSHSASPRAVYLSEAPPHEKMFPQPVGVVCNSPGDSRGAHPRPAT